MTALPNGGNYRIETGNRKLDAEGSEREDFGGEKKAAVCVGGGEESEEKVCLLPRQKTEIKRG